ncbi:hypothetical protein R1flu_017656 [Riccia fluitans]|uniref:Uncharacterized protein n=1 Tax=Riccia fluitans TaxID=41844 RepID=A0ABD1ZDP3_9MARC
MAPVFDKPPTPPVKSTQSAPAPPPLPPSSSSTDVHVRTYLPVVQTPAAPQSRGLKKVASEDDTSLVWRMFSIDW